MKGVILAGGKGTRLAPMTRVTNKHLLPVYDRPMICYPLETLLSQGIRDLMIVTGPEHAKHFETLCGDGDRVWELLGDFSRGNMGGSRYDPVRLHYALQEREGGIADALRLAEDFAGGDSVAVILGDNIYEHSPDASGFTGGARIFLKEVPDAKRFGVATLDENRKVTSIVEKPKIEGAGLAVTGMYLYDKDVFDIIKTLKPSPPPRREFEITDVNNAYVAQGKMDARFVQGFWSDAGTIESLYRASGLVRELREKKR